MTGLPVACKLDDHCVTRWNTITNLVSSYRETVLRFETQFEDKMLRMGRVKIGFKRSQRPVGPLAQVGEAEGQRMV